MATVTTRAMQFLGLLVYFTGTLADDLSNGWGEAYDWKTIDDGKKLAKELKKPVMVLSHKQHCKVCQDLRKQFAKSDELVDMSSDFIMVNILEQQDSLDTTFYAPDVGYRGAYVPRILFLDTDGQIMKQFYNGNGHEDYKYFYPYADDIKDVMDDVRDHFKAKQKKNEL